MTKEEYLKLKVIPQEAWTYHQRMEADALIKSTAIANYLTWCVKSDIPHPVRNLLDSTVTAYFGSVEIDSFLTSIKAYPDWI